MPVVGDLPSHLGRRELHAGRFLCGQQRARRRADPPVVRADCAGDPSVGRHGAFPTPRQGRERPYDLILSALVPYKRDRRRRSKPIAGRDEELVVAGSGVERERLIAHGAAERPLPRMAWPRRDRAARAGVPGFLIFPGRGGLRDRPGRGDGVRQAGCRARPRGGSRDGRRSDETGIFFDEPTPAAMRAAIDRAAIDPVGRGGDPQPRGSVRPQTLRGRDRRLAGGGVDAPRGGPVDAVGQVERRKRESRGSRPSGTSRTRLAVIGRLRPRLRDPLLSPRGDLASRPGKASIPCGSICRRASSRRFCGSSSSMRWISTGSRERAGACEPPSCCARRDSGCSGMRESPSSTAERASLVSPRP